MWGQISFSGAGNRFYGNLAIRSGFFKNYHPPLYTIFNVRTRDIKRILYLFQLLFYFRKLQKLITAYTHSPFFTAIHTDHLANKITLGMSDTLEKLQHSILGKSNFIIRRQITQTFYDRSKCVAIYNYHLKNRSPVTSEN